MKQLLVEVNTNYYQDKIMSFQDAIEVTMKIVAAQIERIHKAIEQESKLGKVNKCLSKEIADLVKMLEKLNEIYRSNDMYRREVKGQGQGILTKIFGKV